MEQRIVDFIAGLRALGVRVSIAESGDAFRAVEQVGVIDRNTFRSALRTTLIKEPQDVPTFERLFPLYFGSGGPPLTNPQEGLSREEQEMLRAALQALLSAMSRADADNPSSRRLTPQELAQLARLLQMLLSGQGPSREEMQHAAQRAGVQRATHPAQQPWLTQRMLREIGMQQLPEALQALLEQLARMGMGREALQQLREMIGENQQALAEQVAQFVGQSLARQATENPRPQAGPDLMQRPFQSLTPSEAAELRNQVRRLAAHLRSRAALRQRRGKEGTLDAKATIRANLRYAGVPVELRFKRRHLKPRLVLICDISTSVRYCAEFMLHLIYELQDQVAKARSFAFIDHLEEISEGFTESRPEMAVRQVLEQMPSGYYNTDLGFSLATFCHDHLDAVDRRTTVIVVGDGRNNYNDPRLDSFQTIKRRAKRILWFNPEPLPLWGAGDSDMYQYIPLCDAVHQVSNLAELADAVDRLFDAR
ncbi:MAG: VWA domain-containing protein [Anaerolineae bacterium]|nr:VWA domain-containing protein [Anaerolineae bacterium]